MQKQLDALYTSPYEGRIVFVKGGAGQGKSSLLSEFAALATEWRSDLLTVAGHCSSYGGLGDPLQPFRQILNQLSGDLQSPFEDGRLNAEQARRLWSASPNIIQKLCATAPDLIGTICSPHILRNRIAQLPDGRVPDGLTEGSRIEGAQDRDLRPHNLYQQLTTFLCDVARGNPLLLVLDDLHWSDPDSLSLLFHLGHYLIGARILVLCAFRPEEALTRVGESTHPLRLVYQELVRRGHDFIDLDETDGRSFVNDYLDLEPNRYDADFRHTLHRLTAGNPLFTVELMHSILETGQVIRDAAGVWQVTQSQPWKHIPPRVGAVIDRRLSVLTNEEYELLAVAAIQGESFLADVVAEILQRPVDEIVRILSDRMERRQSSDHFDRHRTHRIPNHLARFRFSHSLFQQYLYKTANPVELANWHEATANIYVDTLSGPFSMETNPSQAPRLALWPSWTRCQWSDEISCRGCQIFRATIRQSAGQRPLRKWDGVRCRR